MAYADGGGWGERELAEVRGREAQYRERLARRIALGKHLQAHLQRAHALLRADPANTPRLPELLLELARVSGEALGVERASVWLYEPEHQLLRCSVLSVDGVAQPTHDLTLAAAACPTYLSWLREHALLTVEDTRSDPRTAELADYLGANQIRALLDISLSAGGELIGVICHEYTGEPRSWDPEEEAFAWHLGSLVGVALEAERRVRAEYAAKGAEARYRHLVESLPVTVYSLDPDSLELEYVSPQIGSLSPVNAEQWLAAGGRAWIDRICEPERAAVAQRLKSGLSRGYPDELVYRVCLDDQEQVRWIRDTCRVVRDERGEPLAIQGVLADITSQREAELESAEHLRRAQSYMDHAQIFAVKLDVHGRVTDVNPYFLELAGCTREQVVGTDWSARVVPESEREKLRVAYRVAMQTGQIEPRLEYDIRLESGSTRTVLWTHTLLLDTQGTPEGLATLGVDLTDHLRLEAELLEQAKVDSLGRLAAGLAHDFNNLLAVISGQAELLTRYAQDSRADAAKQALAVALAQAAQLTQSMLMYGREQPEKQQQTDVDAVVREVIPLVTALAGKQLDVSTSLHAEGAHVWIDPSQLRQVLLNLAGNAADALKEGGHSIRVTTHLELIAPEATRGRNPAGNYVVLSVADDGPGMEQATIARIFDPFFTTKDAGKGTGLGLPVCDSIVRRAGGFIEVESKPGQGSVFRVFLPVFSGERRGEPVSS